MKNIWVLFVVLCYSGICLAEESNKWFVGLGIGISKYKESSLSENDELISFSGGYTFNDIFSVEAGYIDLGGVKARVVPDNLISLSQDTLSIDVKGFTVSSLFSWQMIDSLRLSAKLGLSSLDVNKQWSGGTFDDPDLASDTGGTETDVYAGVQLQYQVSESLSLGLNWDRYKIEGADIDGVYGRINIHF